MIPFHALASGRTLALGALLVAHGLFPVDAAAQSLGVCNSFYSPGYTLTEGKSNPAVVSMSKPAKGTVFAEPNFGTCMVRGTSHATEPPTTFARNDYSRRQAFNANNTYFIVYSIDGWWHLYDANTLQHLRKLSPRVPNPSTPAEYHMAGDAEPHWHPTDPNFLYYVPTNGGTKLLKLDVRTNAYSVAANFAGALPSWASNARHIWTKSEGSPSADGRYWGFQVENNDFGLLGYIVWDLQQNSLVGSMQSSSRPDHSSMSAAGRWYITSSDSTGTWAWSRDFSTKKKLLHKSEHSDLALGPNGQDYYVSIDYQSGSGDVFFVDIDACPGVPASASSAPVCPRTVLFPTYLNGAATALHVSGKAMSRPGWVVISTYGTSRSRDNSWPWYTNKIFAVELKANPRIYNLAYTRSGGGGYWAEPHASVNRDFTRIIFNSNWGVSGDDLDAYIVHIPTSALPGGTQPPPTPSGPSTGGNLPAQLATGGPNLQSLAASQAFTGFGSSANPDPSPRAAITETGPVTVNQRVTITPAGIHWLRQLSLLLRYADSLRDRPLSQAATVSLATLPTMPSVLWAYQASWIPLVLRATHERGAQAR